VPDLSNVDPVVMGTAIFALVLTVAAVLVVKTVKLMIKVFIVLAALGGALAFVLLRG